MENVLKYYVTILFIRNVRCNIILLKPKMCVLLEVSKYDSFSKY